MGAREGRQMNDSKKPNANEETFTVDIVEESDAKKQPSKEAKVHPVLEQNAPEDEIQEDSDKKRNPQSKKESSEKDDEFPDITDEELEDFLRMYFEKPQEVEPVVITPSEKTKPVIITKNNQDSEHQSRSIDIDDDNIESPKSQHKGVSSERNIFSDKSISDGVVPEKADNSLFNELNNIVNDEATVTCTMYDGNDNGNIKEVTYNISEPDTLPEGSIVLIGEAARQFNLRMAEIKSNGLEIDPYEVAMELVDNKERFKEIFNADLIFQPAPDQFKNILTHVKSSQIVDKIEEDIEKTVSNPTKEELYAKYKENISSLLAEKEPLEIQYSDLRGICENFIQELRDYKKERLETKSQPKQSQGLPATRTPSEKPFNRPLGRD
jgi:hypothetical protein